MMDYGNNLMLNGVNEDHSGHYKCVERTNKDNRLSSYTLIVQTMSNVHTSKGHPHTR